MCSCAGGAPAASALDPGPPPYGGGACARAAAALGARFAPAPSAVGAAAVRPAPRAELSPTRP
eukprot:5407044-Alexandrium_andersonii.AAC.1